MKSYEERREEQRRYEADVSFEVWRSGGNPDRISPDRVSDNYYNGLDSHDAAHCELRAQRPKERIQSEEEWMEQQQQEPTIEQESAESAESAEKQ